MSTHSILNYQNRCEAEVKLKVLEHKIHTGTSTVLPVTGSERCGVAASGAELLEVRPVWEGALRWFSKSVWGLTAAPSTQT